LNDRRRVSCVLVGVDVLEEEMLTLRCRGVIEGVEPLVTGDGLLMPKIVGCRLR